MVPASKNVENRTSALIRAATVSKDPECALQKSLRFLQFGDNRLTAAVSGKVMAGVGRCSVEHHRVDNKKISLLEHHLHSAPQVD